MALKAVHVSEVPNLDQIHENASIALYSNRFPQGTYIICDLYYFILRKIWISWRYDMHVFVLIYLVIRSIAQI